MLASIPLALGRYFELGDVRLGDRRDIQSDGRDIRSGSTNTPPSTKRRGDRRRRNLGKPARRLRRGTTTRPRRRRPIGVRPSNRHAGDLLRDPAGETAEMRALRRQPCQTFHVASKDTEGHVELKLDSDGVLGLVDPARTNLERLKPQRTPQSDNQGLADRHRRKSGAHAEARARRNCRRHAGISAERTEKKSCRAERTAGVLKRYGRP